MLFSEISTNFRLLLANFIILINRLIMNSIFVGRRFTYTRFRGNGIRLAVTPNYGYTTSGFHPLTILCNEVMNLDLSDKPLSSQLARLLAFQNLACSFGNNLTCI